MTYPLELSRIPESILSALDLSSNAPDHVMDHMYLLDIQESETYEGLLIADQLLKPLENREMTEYWAAKQHSMPEPVLALSICWLSIYKRRHELVSLNS